MRRFERLQPAVAPRQGINPFTKKPIVIAGRPERFARCDLEVVGNEVRECWSWLQGARPSADSRHRVRRLPSTERAVAELQEIVEDLVHDDFREIAVDGSEGPSPKLTETVPAAPAPPSWDEGHRLSETIVGRCRHQGWFGCDMRRPKAAARPGPDAVECTRFRYPPASDAQLAETERLLGFSLPPALRAIYSGVANGGLGPGYGFVGVIGGAPESIFGTHLADAYRQERELSRQGQPVEEWPRRILRIVEWGCAIWSCIDARSGQILRYDPTAQGDPVRDMSFEAQSLEEWLQRWLRGADLFHMAEPSTAE